MTYSMANKKRKCKYCKEYALAVDGIKTPVAWFCSREHAVLFAQDSYKKVKVKREKKEWAIRKESIKPIDKWLKEAQASVNKYIRARDKGKPCISCGKISNKEFMTGSNIDAGHYRSRGAASHLRFNLLNIHAQCVKCNRFGSGMVRDYRINLIKRIGLDNVEKLEHDNSVRKFDVEYLKRIKRIFNRRAKYYINRLDKQR